MIVDAITDSTDRLPTPARLRVVPRGLSWVVLTDGPRRMIDVPCTRDRAIEHACEIASRSPFATLVEVENRDGAIERVRPILSAGRAA